LQGNFGSIPFYQAGIIDPHFMHSIYPSGHKVNRKKIWIKVGTAIIENFKSSGYRKTKMSQWDLVKEII